jgi:hypothetical protein
MSGLTKEETASLVSDVKSVKGAFEWVKVSSAKKADPHFPLPMAVQVRIQRTMDAKWYDVEELKIRLHVKPQSVFQVEITDKNIPRPLKAAIEARVTNAWKESREAQPDSFCLLSTFELIQKSFRKLVSLCPELLELYEGVDDDGSTGRRFALVKDVYVEREVKEEEGQEKEGDEAVDPEEVLRKIQALQRQSEQKQKISDEKQREADRKRSLAMEGRLTAKPAQISKKEIAEKKKGKGSRAGQGRLAKTGSRNTKFVGEGSAAEKAAGKKKKKK